MEEVFRQYSGPIIVVFVVVGIIALVAVMLKANPDSAIVVALSSLIDKLAGKVSDTSTGQIRPLI